MAAPAVSDTAVDKNGKPFRTICEGKAMILIPHGAKVGEENGEAQQVFYNPIQQYNRDLSVLAIKTYGEQVLERKKDRLRSRQLNQGKKRKHGQLSGEDGRGLEEQPNQLEVKTPRPSFKILDALSASGLRALRYAKEIPFVTAVKANDLSASAAESIRQNVEYNGVKNIVSVTNDDALAVMYQSLIDSLRQKDKSAQPGGSYKWDVIDLDPYGTAAPFFDAALQAVRDDGGLLCVTCTDSAVWAGHSYSEKTFSLYGGTPIKGLHSHEAGLRLIIQAIATSAARYSLAIEPLLSLSIDFYTKVFIKVTKSPNAVKFHGAKSMVVYSCDQGCGAWTIQHLMRSRAAKNKKGTGAFYKHTLALAPTADIHCDHCGMKMHINGPMYGGYIHSAEFIESLLRQIPLAPPEIYGTLPRLEGMLRTALEELILGPEETESVDAAEARLATIDPYPFFVIPGKLASTLSCVTPGDDVFKGALVHLGYQTGRSHCRPGSVKTDAPWSTIWWIMTEWIRQKAPIKVSKFNSNMAAWKILQDAGLLGDSNSSTTEHANDTHKGSNIADGPKSDPQRTSHHIHVPDHEVELRKTLLFNDDLARLGRQEGVRKLVRYQMNPRENWGPLTKAKND